MTQKSAPAAADPMASETQPLTAGSTVQQAKASMVMAALGRVKENAANTFKEVNYRQIQQNSICGSCKLVSAARFCTAGKALG